MAMPSPSDLSLQSLAEQLRPQLASEIGATQDDVRRASERLGRVPPALLQDESRLHLTKAMHSLDEGIAQITKCLQGVHAQYPGKRGDL